MLVVPDLEAGNMLAKSLSFLAGRRCRRHRSRRPRADHLDKPGEFARDHRLASCAVAVLVANARRANAGKAMV